MIISSSLANLNVNGWVSNISSVVKSNRKATFTLTSSTGSSYSVLLRAQSNSSADTLNVINGHKYFIYFKLTSPYDNGNNNRVYIDTDSYQFKYSVLSGKNEYYGIIAYNGTDGTITPTITFDLSQGHSSVGDEIIIEDYIAFDLTSLGLDTLTAQQFYDKYYPIFDLLASGGSYDTDSMPFMLSESVNMMRKVDLGTISGWAYGGGVIGAYWYVSITDCKKALSNNDIGKVYLDGYTTKSYNGKDESGNSGNQVGLRAISSANGIFVINKDLTGKTPQEVQAYLSGKYLFYESTTDTDIIADITSGKILWEKPTDKGKYGIVDLGTLSWGGSNHNFSVSASSLGAKLPISADTKANVKCLIYTTDTSYNVSHFVTDKTIGIATNGYLYARDDDYTDATTFKNSLNGVYLIYEKA